MTKNSQTGAIWAGASETRSALPFNELIPALRDAFITGCEVPLRHHHAIEQPGIETATLLLMPAWHKLQFLGVKVLTVFPGNSKRGIPGLSSTYLLFDATTGQHLAIIDGNELTARRTAAASALAASFLARKNASSLLIVGAGRVASVLAEAYKTVRPITHVTVWNVNPTRAEDLASKLNEQGFLAEASADLEDSVHGADIVTCATLAIAPLIKGSWLQPGTHLDLIGSFTPTMREADNEAIAGARVFVDTVAAVKESGDLLGPIEANLFSPEDVCGDLRTLCLGESPGRRSETEITLFKSVGTALEDLAAATLVYKHLYLGAA
ncbi:MAG: ornithine cyclodeaminase family protein [Rhodomicrobium sp.]